MERTPISTHPKEALGVMNRVSVNSRQGCDYTPRIMRVSDGKTHQIQEKKRLDSRKRRRKFHGASPTSIGCYKLRITFLRILPRMKLGNLHKRRNISEKKMQRVQNSLAVMCSPIHTRKQILPRFVESRASKRF